MSDRVSVFELETIQKTIQNLNTINREMDEHCDEGIRNAENVYQQAEEELHTSELLLNAAKAQEAIKLALQAKADARMAKAAAQEAAAIASCNPVVIAAASAEAAAATAELARATEEYQKAVQHRERLDHRYELAHRCVNIAQEMCDTLKLRFGYSEAIITEKIGVGNGRLQAAYVDLSRYLSRLTPEVRKEVTDFCGWKPKEGEPVGPKEVHDRLKASNSVLNALLEYLYVTDVGFHCTVERLCEQLKSPDNEASVELQIKKNIVGRLCEELVIKTFGPLGERVETQEVYYLEDGSYTKADMILYGLKEPLILGRGERMGGGEGENLGIEVKSGNKEYLFSQMEHMEKQAQGHSDCAVSCVVCSRDITDLSPEKQEILRERLRAAGSPMLGMLPRKAELDTECINFVKEKAGGKENV